MIKRRILFVDDDVFETEINLEYFEFMKPKLRLAALNIEILAAIDFDMAIRLLQDDGPFHLIIADSLGGDGWTLIKRIRSGEFMAEGSGTSPNVPAIAYTAHASIEFYNSFRSCGFDEVLTKPCLLKDLLKRIFAALELEVPPDFVWKRGQGA